MSHEIETKLIIEGLSIKLGHRILEKIVDNIPDIQANKKAFEALASSSNYKIRESISKKEHINKKTISILLNDTNEEMKCKMILSNRSVNRKITQKQLERIIDSTNTRMICAIADSLNEFKKCKIKKIQKKLLSHPSSKVRYVFAYCSWRYGSIFTDDLRKLAKDNDPDVAKMARKSLAAFSIDA